MLLLEDTHLDLCISRKWKLSSSQLRRKEVTDLSADVSQLLVEKLCQRLSHREKVFVLLLQDTHFGHKLVFEMEDKLFTSL